MRRNLTKWVLVAVSVAIAAGCGVQLGGFRLVSPHDGSSVAVAQPRFVWTAAPNAIGYTLIMRNAAGDLVWQATTTATEVLYNGPVLANGAAYQWQVTANFTPPVQPTTSPWWSFTKVAAGVMEPTLVSPPDSTWIATGTPTFNWQPPAGATPLQSKVEVRNSAGGLIWDTVTTGTATSAIYAGPVLMNGATYSWLVVAVHASPNPSTRSVEWTFTKVAAGAMTPTLVSPEDRATVATATPTFTWQPPAGGAPAQYKLEVRNSAGALIWDIATTATSAAYAGAALVNGQTYSWLVIAVHVPPNPPVQSMVWTFTKVVP